MKSNRVRFPVLFTLAYIVVFALLMLFRSDNEWIDRVIIGEIAICAAFAVGAMSVATKRWTVRGLGIWGLMFAIALIYTTSQLIQFGVIETSPSWLRNFWRAVLAVAGPCMLYGYYRWWRDGDGEP